jgi:hypothetical protein
MKFKDFYKLYTESLSDWSGEWVHYTNIPYLSFNPKAFHADPTGIYFFPKEFKPNSSYSSRKYKFSAKLKPDAKVLDFSKITREEMTRLADLAGVEKFIEIEDLYPSLRNVFKMTEGPEKKAGSFNRFFVNAGYDAIFDDINIVYGRSEKQLIVLNQKCLSDVEMHINKYSIYNEMTLSSEEIIKRLTPYCDSIENTKIKKRREGWIRNDQGELIPDYMLEKYMTFKKGKNYLSILAYSNSGSKKTNEIDFSIVSTSLRLKYNSGASYDYAKKEWNFNSIEKIVKDAISILTGEDDRI